MSSLEIEQTSVDDGAAVQAADEDDVSPIEEVRLTVYNDDDTTLPVGTFRMWFIGVFSNVLLSFLNTFFSYRSNLIGYLFQFQTPSTISWVRRVFPMSITAHQIGSGVLGIGLGSVALDWSVIASFVNIFIGFALFMYAVLPISYWGPSLYHARTFPIFSSHLFNNNGELYNISGIVNPNFEIEMPAYEQQGRVKFVLNVLNREIYVEFR
ncbi:hypothetical protein V6N11_053371 [Hibiscus sabdariffa]|uniref:Uncharacterized protein n=1 Tax=Hibiscus sabdariffa TaxID=183260 RepID=A0ABR2UCW0_9ROSI